MLRLNDALRQAVRAGNHNDQMRSLARHDGIKFMQEYALDLVRDGLTTFEEVQRVVAFGHTTVESCGSCARELSPNFAFCPFCGVKRHSWHLQMPVQHAASKREAVNE
jgi:type IV pilus assembly protein PilB